MDLGTLTRAAPPSETYYRRMEVNIWKAIGENGSPASTYHTQQLYPVEGGEFELMDSDI